MARKEAIIDIGRRHPTWKKMSPLWRFYHDSYKGGTDYVASNLKNINVLNVHDTGSYLEPHEIELKVPGRFIARHKRSKYINYCKLPINTFTKYIFTQKKPVERVYLGEDTQSNYHDYIADITLTGLDINEFMKSITINMLTYGISYIIVDKKPLPDDINNLEDQRRGDYRAYVSQLMAKDVIDWSIDDTGAYNWALVKSLERIDSDYKKTAEDVDRFWLFTKDEIYYLDESGKAIDDYPINNSLNEVPIIPCGFFDVDNDGIPESILVDIAPINKELYNVLSLYQEELYKIAFAQLLVQKGKGDWDEGEGVVPKATAPDLIMPYPADANAPQWNTFPTDALVEKRAYMNELRMDILRMANLEKQDGIDGQHYLSGLAMAWSYNDTYFTVAQMAAKVQQFEIETWKMINKYDNGLVDGEIEITYPTDYDVLSTQLELEAVKELRLTPPPTALGQVKLDMYMMEQALKDVSEEELSEIEKELTESYKSIDSEEKASKEAGFILNDDNVDIAEKPIPTENDEYDRVENTTDTVGDNK